MSGESEYTLQIQGNRASLSGVMRLVSPAAYQAALQAVHDRLASSSAPFELDVSGLQFLNSGGITALSRLVLLARGRSVPLVVVIDEGVLWQKKTLPSLAKLYPGMTLRGA